MKRKSNSPLSGTRMDKELKEVSKMPLRFYIRVTIGGTPLMKTGIMV